MNTHNDIPLAELPASASLDDFDTIFGALHDKVSDFFIQPDSPIVVRYKGLLVQATKREVSEKAMGELIEKMVGSTRQAEIMKGFPQSWSHRIRVDGDIHNNDEGATVMRFRCNSKSVQTLYSAEVPQITIRPIEARPRELKSLNLPPKLVEGLFPESGMVLFSGPTGSGKTTTLAAVMNDLCYDPEGKVIVTIEDPVEYNLHVLKGKTAFVTHTEIGRNVREFPLAMRASLRENPDVIMTGEMRDEESMLIGVEASQTGHAVYSTIHCNSAANVFVRVAQKMPPERVMSVLSTFIEASRTFVYQRLFPSKQGGVVPVIEYVCLSGQDRADLLEALSNGGIAAVSRKMTDVMNRSGKWYVDAAREALEADKLTEAQFARIVRTYEIETEAERKAGG